MKRLVAVLALFLIPLSAFAVNATSTSFYVRQNVQSMSGGNSTWSFSTSTSFRFLGAGGQTAVGTSTPGTNYSLGGGILQNLTESIQPAYTLAHYHWRNDDGSETTATQAVGSQDVANSAVAKSTTVRLRVAISNEGGTEGSYTTQQFRLEYGLKSTTCAAIVSWTDVGAGAGDWDMSNSANLTNGANTTNIALGVGGVSDENNRFVTSNGSVLDTASQSSAVSVASDAFIELEYSITALTAATDGGTYCFRVTNAGSTSLYTYSVYPEAVISSPLTFTTTTNQFGTLTPGTAKFATTTLSVSSSNSTGWNVILSGDDRATGNTTLDLTTDPSVGITDQTEWIPGAATTTAGNAVRIGSLINSADVLAFRVMTASGTAAFRASAWWGTTDAYTDSATTLWAGFASSTASNKKIGNTSVTSGGTALSTVLYYLDVPTTQQNGSYDGGLTYTATANP